MIYCLTPYREYLSYVLTEYNNDGFGVFDKENDDNDYKNYDDDNDDDQNGDDLKKSFIMLSKALMKFLNKLLI